MTAIGYTELARAALAFATEDETWPVFIAWCASNSNSTAMDEWVETAALATVRREWLASSPDPIMRAAAKKLAQP